MEHFYLDDGFMIGEHKYLRAQLSRFSSETAEEYGLQFCLDKCKVWWQVMPPSTERHLYPSPKLFEIDLPNMHKPDGTQILGSAVGLLCLHSDAFKILVKKCEDFLYLLRKLGNAQTGLELHRSCFSSS